MEYSSRVKQIGIYFGKRKREFLNSKGPLKTALYTLCISLFLLLVLGSDFFEVKQGSIPGLFILSCICIFYGLFNSLETVCSEREIIKHEHRSGMYLSAYILGNAAFDFFVCLIHAGVTWLVVMVRYLPTMIRFDKGYTILHLIGHFLTMLIITYAADALGLCISSIVKSQYQAMKVMPFVMILQIAFADVMLELTGIIKGISKFTLSKWGTNALYDVEFGGDKLTMQESLALLAGLSAPDKPGFLLCWCVLLLFTIVFLALAILFIRSVDKDTR